MYSERNTVVLDKDVRRDFGSVKVFFAAVFFCLCLILFVNGLAPQLQMLIFSGRVPMHASVFKGALIAVCVMYILLSQKIYGSFGYGLIWFGALSIFLISILVNFSEGARYELNALDTNYLYLVLLPFALPLSGAILERRFIYIIAMVFCLLALFAMAQFAFNSPLIPTASKFGYYIVNSYEFHGHVRSFSLFSSGSSFGHFLSLIAAYLVFKMIQRPVNSKHIILFLFCVVCTYMTLTRATYIELILTLFASYLYGKGKINAKGMTSLIFIYGLFGGVIIVFAPIVSMLFPSTHLFNDQTLISRFNEWRNVLGAIREGGVVNLLFGSGMAQGVHGSGSRGLVVDNGILAIIYQIGVFGLAAVSGLMCYAWKWLVDQSANVISSPLLGAVMAWFTTLLFTSTLGITYPIYALVVLSVSVVDFSNKYAVRNIF